MVAALHLLSAWVAFVIFGAVDWFAMVQNKDDFQQQAMLLCAATLAATEQA